MELSKGATAGIIAVVVILVLGIGWAVFMKPRGGANAVLDPGKRAQRDSMKKMEEAMRKNPPRPMGGRPGMGRPGGPGGMQGRPGMPPQGGMPGR